LAGAWARLGQETAHRQPAHKAYSHFAIELDLFIAAVEEKQVNECREPTGDAVLAAKSRVLLPGNRAGGACAPAHKASTGNIDRPSAEDASKPGKPERAIPKDAQTRSRNTRTRELCAGRGRVSIGLFPQAAVRVPSPRCARVDSRGRLFLRSSRAGVPAPHLKMHLCPSRSSQ
jgi:hypothetical protein